MEGSVAEATPAIVTPGVIVPPVKTDTPTETTTPTAADLVKRNAPEVTLVAKTPEQEKAELTTIGVNLDDIKDPAMRQILDKKIKDLEKGANDKYMQLAELRKAADAFSFEQLIQGHVASVGPLRSWVFLVH